MQAHSSVRNAGSRGDAKTCGKPAAGQRQQQPSPPGGNTPLADYRGMSRPLYRGPISHNVIAELTEGYRVLSGGQEKVCIPTKDIYALMDNVGLHLSEEEFHDALRVIGQSEPHNADELSFTDFLLLMTQEVDEVMVDELRSAFHQYDKQKTGFVTRKQFTELFATLGERSTPDELEDLLAAAETDETDDKIDYNRFVNELAFRVNRM